MRQILTIVSKVVKLDADFFAAFEKFIGDQIKIISFRDLAIEEAREYELVADASLAKNIVADFCADKKVDFFLRSKDSYSVRKKLLISDMDATLIANECIDEMAKVIGKGKEIEEITQKSMEGNLLFESSLELRVSLLKGMDVNLLKEIYDEVIKLNSGVGIVAKTLKVEGIKSMIVSGGFTYFTNNLRNLLDFDYDFANVLEVEEGKLTGKVVGPIFGSKDKLIVLQDIMQKEVIHKNEVIGIGDGANDLPFLTFIENGIGYKAKPIVRQSLDHNIINSDFTSILYFLGIPKKNFLTP